MCREYAVIIESLAAAPHVLLIPKQTLSCFPTLASTEVFCFLLSNGLTVLLHSSTSNRTIHIYHVWAFHSIIEVILVIESTTQSYRYTFTSAADTITWASVLPLWKFWPVEGQNCCIISKKKNIKVYKVLWNFYLTELTGYHLTLFWVS